MQAHIRFTYSHDFMIQLFNEIILELFDTASHACGWRQEGHPVVKTSASILFINTPGEGML